MRHKLGGRWVAAAVAAAVFGGAAAADPPAPAAPAAPAVVAGSGGCATGNCGGGFAGPGAAAGGHRRTGHRGFVMSHANNAAFGGYFTDSCPYGRGCNNGCGSLRSDAGFVFGSCRSFFAPCGPGLLDCGHGRGCGGGLFGKCPKDGPGVPRSGPSDPCKYDSYLNH